MKTFTPAAAVRLDMERALPPKRKKTLFKAAQGADIDEYKLYVCEVLGKEVGEGGEHIENHKLCVDSSGEVIMSGYYLKVGSETEGMTLEVEKSLYDAVSVGSQIILAEHEKGECVVFLHP